MAKCKLPPFILSLSGKVGNLCFRTSASGRTLLYPCPKKQQNKTPTQCETKARELFKERVIQVNNIKKQNPSISHKEAWKIAMKNYEKSN